MFLIKRDYGEGQNDYGSSIRSLLTTIALGGVLAIVQLIGLLVYRRSSRKVKRSDDKQLPPRDHDSTGARAVSRVDLLRHGNPDAYGFYTFVDFLFKLFLLPAFVAIPILIPFNYEHSSQVADVTGLDVFSCLNIPATEAHRFWGHFGVAMGFILYFGFLVWKEARGHIAYLSRRAWPVDRYLLANVQRTVDGRDPEASLKITDSGYVQLKHSAMIKLVQRIECMCVVMIRAKDRPKTSHKERLCAAIEELQELIQFSTAHDRRDTANDVRLAPEMSTGSLHHNKDALWPLELHAVDHEFRDVVWTNVFRSRIQRRLQWLVSWVLISFLSVFLAIPLSVGGLSSQLAELLKVWDPDLDESSRLQWILSTIEGSIPQTIMLVVVSMSPFILRTVCKFNGALTHMQMEKTYQHHLFVYLFLQVFIFTSVAITLGAIMSFVVHDPVEVPEILALNLARSGDYFITYVILQGLSLSIAAMVDWVALIKGILAKNFGTRTPRQVFNAGLVSQGDWATLYPTISVVGAIGISYAMMAPLIVICSLLTFGLLRAAYSQTLVHMQPSRRDSKGTFFFNAVHHVFFGVYSMELNLIGIFVTVQDEHGDRVCIVAAGLMTGTFVMTILFQLYLDRRIKTVMRSPKLHDSRFVQDYADRKQSTEGLQTESRENATSCCEVLSLRPEATTDGIILHPVVHIWIPPAAENQGESSEIERLLDKLLHLQVLQIRRGDTMINTDSSIGPITNEGSRNGDRD